MTATNHDFHRRPLLILGIDAGDADLLLKWSAAGLLPNIKSLLDRGCWARTGGPELISEHGVWMSIASGISRGEYGFYYFRQLIPGTYNLAPITGHDLNVEPFWASLAGSERRVIAMDIPDVLPVAKLAGLQLANWAVHQGWVTDDPRYAPVAEPASLLDEARRVFGERMDIVEHVGATVEQSRAIFRDLMEQVTRRGKLLRHAVKQGRFDLFVTVFGETHTATHQFWQYRADVNGDGVSRGADPQLAHAIRELYIATDREIGLLLAELPKDVNVALVTSVGIGDFFPTSQLVENFCRTLGYQASPPPAPISLHPMSIARRVLPESVRIWLSRFLPREKRERILADQFRNNTDWSKTTAFAIPSFYSSFIRVNLRGREPQGIVEPGAEYAALLARLEADVNQLIDPRTGRSPVETVMRGSEIIRNSSGAPPRVMPDLLIVWKQHQQLLDRLVHPRGEITQSRPEWCRDSDHVRQGFVAFAGPDVTARGDLGEVDVLDLAPTFLALMGTSAPAKMCGKILPVAAPMASGLQSI